MTGEPFDREEWSPEEREALRWVGSTPVPAPSPEARERAREAFLTGLRPAAARRRAPGRRVTLPFAIAAALAGLLWLGSRPAEQWTVLEGTGTGVRRADGTELAAGDRISGGLAATEGTGALEVQLGGRLRLLIPPGSRVRLPRGPGRFGLGRTRVLRVERGQLFATSGGRALGFELLVESPETITRILGTTFAVRRNDSGTCVCLYSGKVEVRSVDGRCVVDVPKDMRVQFFRDGREPRLETLSPGERRQLERLERAGLAPIAR